ncbi:FabD/lysophospholipase-like protein [Colletotrichum caudatum]|nr:FabD/lysophospholipase-like protein [Colletotrichum caudatum]
MVPFYRHVRIPTEVQPWPQVAPGHPRRASVNSFGRAARQARNFQPHARGGFKRDNKGQPKNLGIFTGQGVQWPGMCNSLLASIPWTRDIIDELDASLKTLPAQCRPAWKLWQKLSFEGDWANATEASFSQPLCAAVQLVLIRLLEAAGITFTAIAIRIAYLRGLAVTTPHAGFPSGTQGLMLVAEITQKDAEDLCDLEEFEGRTCVAAYNSPTSVTLSGDAEALQFFESVLKDEGKFARLLRVDKTYHSHHMVPCGDAYAKALVDCDCAGNAAPEAPNLRVPVAWYSSVYEGRLLKCTDITAEYWKANLISPVLFAQAVERASRKNLARAIRRYSWDHTRTYWIETRAEKAFLSGPARHLLLGSLLLTTTDSTFQWQSFIRPQDDKWFEGHHLQTQLVVPASGYVVMAMEAELHVARKRVAQDVDVAVLEVLDLSIDKAMTFDDQNSMAELLVTLKVIDQSAEHLSVEVRIDSALERETKPYMTACGHVVVTFGSPSTCSPQRGLDEPLHPNGIDVNRFYEEIERLGIAYTKKYHGIHELRRADCRAAGRPLHYRLPNTSSHEIVVYPATLDTAFQAVMGTYSIALFPGACASALDSCDEITLFFGYFTDQSHRILDRPEFCATDEDKRMIPVIKRIIYHYVKDFLNNLTQEDRRKASPSL